jgi:hypothetical protein
MFTCDITDSKKGRTRASPSYSGSLSGSDSDSLGTSVQNNPTSKREVKLTSESLKDTWRRNSLRRSCSLCVSVQRHLGNTGLVRKNLDTLHCGTGDFG